MSSNSSQFKEILIPANLYNEIEDRIRQTEFESVEAYISYVLSEVLSDEEVEAFSLEEEEEMKNRLKDLGYIG